ncbi:MAG: hypothetical protein K1X64_08210 [Myxococcaceae bacterium]|nr:hypothetical protein [Myxococcaceae bacterium]
MNQLRLMTAVVFVFSLGAVGCGGGKGQPTDGGTGGGTAGTGGGMGSTGGGMGNTGGGMGGTGGGMGTGGGLMGVQVSEGETPTEKTNNEETAAETLVVDTVVNGTIGNWDTMAMKGDVDYYKFTATEGEVYRITVQPAPGSAFQPTSIVVNDSDYYREATPSGAATDPGTRQFFIPKTGVYYVAVADARNLDDQNPGMQGGPDLTYQLQIVKETLTPSAVTLPVTAQAGTLSADGKVQAFSFTATAGEVVHGEVVAGALMPASDVDPAIYLVDNSTGTPKVVGALEDNDALGGDYDVTLNTLATNGGAYYFVVDYGSVLGPARNFTMTFTSAPPPPGASCATAIAIASPGMVSGNSNGFFNNVDVTDMGSMVCSMAFSDSGGTYSLPGPDMVYSISVPAGKTLTATVLPSGGWDSAVAIVTDCAMAATSCVAGGDQGLDDAADSATYTNSTAQAQQVFIIVDAWDGSQHGAFTLTTAIP